MAKVPRHDIATAVLGLLDGGKKPAEITQALASYLIAERRTRELDALMRDIETMRFRRDGILEATVTSARPLDESVRAAIKTLLPAKQVHLHHRLSPDVVGGVRVHALDTQLDSTIQTKLTKLKHLTTVKN